MKIVNISPVIILFVLFGCKPYVYKIPYLEDKDERYMSCIWLVDGYRDTSKFNTPSQSYNNGNFVRKYYLNDSLYIDSIHRFHYDGSISTRGINHYNTNRFDSINGKLYFFPNKFVTTYYENGNLRGRENCVLYPSNYFFYKSYYDLNEDIIYEEIYTIGDTTKGTFYQNYGSSDFPLSPFKVYDNNKLTESWYISKHDSLELTISKIVLHDKNKTLKLKYQIKRKVKNTPIVGFNWSYFGLVIANGKGRKFDTYKKPELEYRDY